MREHFLQQADIKWMMRMMVAAVMVTVVMVVVAMAGKFCLEGETLGFAAVVMMVGYNGMQHDNRTCHRNHYLCHQMFHTITFTSFLIPHLIQ